MKIDATTFRLLTEPVRDALVDWMKSNGLPDHTNVLEIEVDGEETKVTVVFRENGGGDIALERGPDGSMRPKQKTFTHRTSQLPGRVRRAFA